MLLLLLLLLPLFINIFLNFLEKKLIDIIFFVVVVYKAV
jgi:hypothetical protein